MQKVLFAIAVIALVLGVAGCGQRIDESGGPAPVDSHGQPLLLTPDGTYVEEPTPIPAWAILQEKRDTVARLKWELAQAEAALAAAERAR